MHRRSFISTLAATPAVCLLPGMPHQQQQVQQQNAQQQQHAPQSAEPSIETATIYVVFIKSRGRKRLGLVTEDRSNAELYAGAFAGSSITAELKVIELPIPGDS